MCLQRYKVNSSMENERQIQFSWMTRLPFNEEREKWRTMGFSVIIPRGWVFIMSQGRISIFRLWKKVQCKWKMSFLSVMGIYATISRSWWGSFNEVVIDLSPRHTQRSSTFHSYHVIIWYIAGSVNNRRGHKQVSSSVPLTAELTNKVDCPPRRACFLGAYEDIIQQPGMRETRAGGRCSSNSQIVPQIFHYISAFALRQDLVISWWF